MNKTKTGELKNTTAAAPVPQAKRYDEAFKRQAVELDETAPAMSGQ
jgi:hypothetical protein